MSRLLQWSVLVGAIALVTGALPAVAADKKPNIVVIFGDDIGTWNISAYSLGMMGRTPNIDRIGKEGIIFTDHYGQPSCTAQPQALDGKRVRPERFSQHPGLACDDERGRLRLVEQQRW